MTPHDFARILRVMRKIILALAVSLDGYVARENGDVDWLKMQDLSEAADESREFFASIDAILWGRKTFSKSEEMGGDLNMFGAVMNYVFTRTPRTSEIKNLQFVSENAAEFAADLKRTNGENILLMGGGNVAATFFAAGLIDEMILGIQPVILGGGIPLFPPPQKQLELERIDVKLRKSGTVQISYRVKN